MYKHILVPTDGSALSLKAAHAGADLAARIGARLSAVYVIPPYVPPSGGDAFMYYDEAFSPREYDKAMKAYASKALAKVEAIAQAKKVDCAKYTVSGAQPWEGIIDTARARKCDLITMASHGRRGLAGVILGSETTKVLTHSKTPVLVCR
jgi:nucleotide-binding universal stress UspA family protein